MTDAVFVFGSNLAGRHGRGAAKFAHKKRGAIYGQAEGLQGQSYGIPTKDCRLETLDLKLIEQHVKRFIMFAEQNGHLKFEVTPIGTGLAGYSHGDIAPMFKNATDNCMLPSVWKPWIDQS